MVENVKIGDDVTIGVGTIIVKDIKEGDTAAGNPAKISQKRNLDVLSGEDGIVNGINISKFVAYDI